MPEVSRSGSATGPRFARFANLSIDYFAREVTLDGRLLSLTKSEFAVLAILSACPRVVITREQLLSEVWETTWLGDVSSIEVHVSRLRSKLGESGLHWHYIQTVRGIGYMFTLHPDEISEATHPDLPLTEEHTADDPGEASASLISPVIAFIGLGGALIWVSKSVTQLLGHQPADLVGILWTSLAHVDDLPSLATVWLGLLAGNPQVLTMRIRDTSLQYVSVLTHLTPMAAEGESLTGMVVEWQPFTDLDRDPIKLAHDLGAFDQ